MTDPCPRCGSAEQRKDGRCAPCARARERRRGRDPEYREKRRVAASKYRTRPEVQARRRDYQRDYAKAYRQTAHGRAILDANQKRYRENPEHQERMREYRRGYQQRPEVKAKARAKGAGLLPSDIHALLERVGFACPICHRAITYETAHVDHCKVTKTVRDVLCRHCNAGLGRFEHDPDLLARAAEYLARHGSPRTPIDG